LARFRTTYPRLLTLSQPREGVLDEVDAWLRRKRVALGAHLAAEHQRARLLSYRKKEGVLLLASQMVDGEHSDHQIPWAFGDWILDPRHSYFDPKLACSRDHLRAGVR
jgi:hypothetical protein